MTLPASISNEQLLEAAIRDVARSMEKVGPQIDKLTSASLKRVLKTVTHVHLAEHITQGKQMELNETEQNLVDHIFGLQENVLGYMQLDREINGTKQEENNE